MLFYAFSFVSFNLTSKNFKRFGEKFRPQHSSPSLVFALTRLFGSLSGRVLILLREELPKQTSGTYTGYRQLAIVKWTEIISLQEKTDWTGRVFKGSNVPVDLKIKRLI